MPKTHKAARELLNMALAMSFAVDGHRGFSVPDEDGALEWLATAIVKKAQEVVSLALDNK